MRMRKGKKDKRYRRQLKANLETDSAHELWAKAYTIGIEFPFSESREDLVEQVAKKLPKGWRRK